MNKLNFLTKIGMISLLFPFSVLASTCSDTVKTIIENAQYDLKNPSTLKDLAKLSSIVGPGEKKSVTEQSYTWKSDKGLTYTIVVRDGVTIAVENKGMNPDFGNKKFPTLAKVTKQLGKPELGPVKQLTKTLWSCTDTHSVIAIFSNASGEIISYTGQYCPSLIFNTDCVAFGDWTFSS